MISLFHQYRVRPVCTFMQSDQALYFWLANFKFLSWYPQIDNGQFHKWKVDTSVIKIKRFDVCVSARFSSFICEQLLHFSRDFDQTLTETFNKYLCIYFRCFVFQTFLPELWPFIKARWIHYTSTAHCL